MQSKDNQDEPGLKPDIKRFLAVLGLPLLVQIGAVTPLFENSRFFAEGGWWDSLSGLHQFLFVLLGWGIWIVGVTVLALLLSFFSRRWRQNFWLPGARLLRGAISWLGLRLVSRTDMNRLIEQEGKVRAKREADAVPPKGRHGRLAGQTIYGRISTHRNLNDLSLLVKWRSSGLVLGKLIPCPGDIWEVHYGRLEKRGFQPQFLKEENLGRVEAPWEGVDLLRRRDLQKGLGIQQTHHD
ncbi:hypothetical protein [Paeniglutamicibacter psychrophenolicus]|uniref:hypothetical protein n=1 Tax=Paeniglutamicibacter psychrophenolicus TaxID=257454 RepID=UPI002780B4B6|nr:hypothetical protein [Paeniglutamicibacter psychrophenolicus]MDQ0093069.1 hypothetical protein [Paeniglutamicibacter psychrophenolicus]